MGQHLDPVDPVVAEGDPPLADRHRQQSTPRGPWIATDLEDVGAVHPQIELQRDVRGLGGVVDDAHPLLEPVGADQALAPDPDRPPHDLVEWMHLGVGIAVRGRIRHLDAAPVVSPDGGLQQHRSHAADPQHRAGQRPRVALVQPEPARVGMDVPERIGQQIAIPVLEDLDGAEVRRLLDRDIARRQEADLGDLRLRHRSPRSRTGARPGPP